MSHIVSINNTDLQAGKFYLPSLNGLRALSIIIVICAHLDDWYKIYPSKFTYVPFIRDGQFGVNIFFIISGFLITTLLMREEAAYGRIAIANFYKRRIFRIFPAYYFLLLIYFFLQLFGYLKISNQSWITSLTYTKYLNWFGSDWETAHTWSLGLEELFYLLWPLIFLCGNRFRKFVIIATILSFPLVRVYLYLNDWTKYQNIHIYLSRDAYIILRLDAIAMGCLFALFRNHILKILSRRWKLAFYLSLALLLSIPLIQIINDKVNLHLAYINIGAGGMHSTFSNLFVAVIIMFSVFGPTGLWYQFLNTKLLNFIGILSYSLYLWQQLFIKKTHFLINSFPLNLFFILLVASFSYYIIEKPFLALKANYQKASQEDLLIK